MVTNTLTDNDIKTIKELISQGFEQFLKNKNELLIVTATFLGKKMMR
jgi:hypothetical protein